MQEGKVSSSKFPCCPGKGKRLPRVMSSPAKACRRNERPGMLLKALLDPRRGTLSGAGTLRQVSPCCVPASVKRLCGGHSNPSHSSGRQTSPRHPQTAEFSLSKSAFPLLCLRYRPLTGLTCIGRGRKLESTEDSSSELFQKGSTVSLGVWLGW